MATDRLSMATSNEDLRVRIEQIDGKLNTVKSSLDDLKVAALGISALGEKIATLNGTVQQALDGSARNKDDIGDVKKWIDTHETWTEQTKLRFETNSRQIEDKINVQVNWRNWIMGGLSVVALCVGGLFYIAAGVFPRMSELEVNSATHTQRLQTLERKSLVDEVRK